MVYMSRRLGHYSCQRRADGLAINDISAKKILIFLQKTACVPTESNGASARTRPAQRAVWRAQPNKSSRINLAKAHAQAIGAPE